MVCGIFRIKFVFICIFSFVITAVLIFPLYAGEQSVGNAAKTDQTISTKKSDETTKNNPEQEFIQPKGLRYITANKNPKPQGAGHIRLKPRLEDDSVVGLGKVFAVDFMDGETSVNKTKKDSNDGPYMKFEQIEDLDKSNGFLRKEPAKDYKTELSMGFKISPYTEIYLGKGFLVERKEKFTVDPRDDGWRIKFKLDF